MSKPPFESVEHAPEYVIIIAGPDKLPAISRYYHDASPDNALVPDGCSGIL